MKNLIKTTGLALALCAQSVYAIPALFFDGEISFDASTGELSVNSVLTATTDITPAPNLIGSSLSFMALLDNVDDSHPIFTVGSFMGVRDDDLEVTDGDLNTLLTGDFNSLEMKGANGRDFGLVSGEIDATGGSLQNLFGTSNLIALEFNLSTLFGSTMFDSSFTGRIDGRIVGQEQPVTEPAVLTLLGFSLVLMGVVRNIRTRCSNRI